MRRWVEKKMYGSQRSVEEGGTYLQTTSFYKHRQGFGKVHPSHLHLLDGPPIVCFLPSRQEHTDVYFTGHFSPSTDVFIFLKDRKMNIIWN